MAVLYGTQMTKIIAGGGATAQAPDIGGKVRCFTETVTLASQATTDTIVIARIPKGARVLYGILNTNTSLGSSTIAIGVSGTAAAMKAAAVFTATDTPTPFGKADFCGVAATAQTDLIVTIAAAALPASGSLKIQTFYTYD